MEEIWRDIPGYRTYEVSNYGRVRRKTAYKKYAVGHLLKSWMEGTKRLYHYYDLKEDGRKQKVGAHQLVAVVFIGPRPSPKHEVAHWDGDPSNNWDGNIRWATKKENHADVVRHGRISNVKAHGEDHPSAKLNENDVINIRRSFTGKRGEVKAFAEKYGVTPRAIRTLVLRETWKHVA